MPATSGSPGTVDVPRPLTTAALDLLERCEGELVRAAGAAAPAERYVHAHLAALRAGAAVVAVHGRPAGPRRHGPRSVWEMLPRLDPELQGWSHRFAATASRRSAVEAGRTGVVSAADADALLADAESFYRVVEFLLGLGHQQPMAG